MLSPEMLQRPTLGCNFASAIDDELREAFNDWNSRAVSFVPEERLLIFNPKDGWGSLFEFLDLREPKIFFPHVNKREDMTAVLTNQLSRGAFFDRLIFNILTLFILYAMLFIFHLTDDLTLFFLFVNITFMLSCLLTKTMQTMH